MSFSNYVCLFFALIGALGFFLEWRTNISDPIEKWEVVFYVFIIVLALAGTFL